MIRLMSMLGAVLLVCRVAVVEAADPTWLDRWRDATVALGVVKQAKVMRLGKEVETRIFAVVGTAVLLGRQSAESGDRPPILITAKHVFSDPLKKWNPDTLRLRFAWFEGRAVEDYLGIEVPLMRDGKPLWMAHPNADIAGLELKINKADAGRENVATIPFSNFASANEIYEGAQVLVLGYPGAVGRTFWTRALVRGGTIAWVNPASPATERLVVDSLLFPGNSGGPVIKVPIGMGRMGGFEVGTIPRFLGIVSEGRTEQMPLTVDGKEIEIQGPAGKAAIVAGQHIGVAVIEPAAKVRELIELIK